MFSLPIIRSLDARASARRLTVEPLEDRKLFSVSPNDFDDHEGLLSHGGGCGCPICGGTIAFAPEMRAEATPADLVQSALSSLPLLSSLPSSQFTLFLDFDGGYTSGWETNAVYTPAYDYDGNFSTFSTSELNSIHEIWKRVSEDYAPFNINVTTIDPGNLTNGRVAKIAIGGNYDDWFGDAAGGVAYVGGFYNSAPNTGFVFSDALGNGTARYVAEAASHEAGHLFGLWHQSSYNSSGGKTAEYSTGSNGWAPIMGVGYYASVTTWYNGPNNLGPTSLQDEMSILSGSANGFGYRTDDAGDNTASTATLSVNGTTVSGSGIVGRNNDLDYYRFSTTGGAVNISAANAGVGANLDVVLELRRADGSLVTSASPTTSLNATISANLTAGDYFLVVRSTGVYGYVGQYTLAGTVPTGTTGGSGGGSSGGTGDTGGGTSGGGGGTTGGGDSGGNTPTGPEITVLEGGNSIADNTATIAFGSVRKGTVVSKTFTVRNDGDANLSLVQIKDSHLPKGFRLIRGFSDLQLSAGESTTFVVNLTTNRGSYGGWVSINNNDADERPFNFRVTGAVTRTGVAGIETVAASNTLDVAMGVDLVGATSNELNLFCGPAGSSEAVDVIHAQDGRDVIASQPVSAAPRALIAADRVSRASINLAEVDRCFDDRFAELTELLTEALTSAA